MLPKIVPVSVRSAWSCHSNSLLRKNTLMPSCVKLIGNSTTDAGSAVPSEDENVQGDRTSIRNKSKLNRQHYEQLHGIAPSAYGNEAPTPYMKSLHFARKMYARHGETSGVNAAVLWPTKEEFTETKEFEDFSYPNTLQEMIKLAKLKEQEEAEAIQKRMALIEERMSKLNGWKREVIQRKNKKEAEIRAAQEKKDRMYEEVRQFFGYSVDPKDERFKQMLEEKEKEDKKTEKEIKKQAKAAKAAKSLLHFAKAAETKESQSSPPTS